MMIGGFIGAYPMHRFVGLNGNITIVGGCLTGLGWLLSSFDGSVQWLYIFYGVIAGIGVGIAYGVPVAVAARWFPDRRGLAVGPTLLGFVGSLRS